MPDDGHRGLDGQPWTPRAWRTLEEAISVAQELGEAYIGTEHLLLALLNLPGGIATNALSELINRDALRDTIMHHIRPAPIAGYEQFPGPWSSGVVHDLQGHPRVRSDGNLVQYFIDASGVPVRNPAGRLVHFAIPDSPRSGLAAVDLAEGDQDHEGRRLS